VHAARTGGRSDQPGDVAGVLAPPPVIYGAALILGVLAHLIWPLRFGAGWAPAAGLSLIAVALLVATTALRAMMRAGTRANPHKPTTMLLTTGIYAASRNPMYLALNILYLGIALTAGSLWVLMLIAPALATLRYGVISREERYLQRRFGEDYLAYRKRTRRWL